MYYKQYIELGFVRTDMNDKVEFDQTGYYGFALEKKINDNMMVCVTSLDLHKPKLYIKKRGEETYNIIEISTSVVLDLFEQNPHRNNMAFAC